MKHWLLLILFSVFLSGCTGGGGYYDDYEYDDYEDVGTGVTSDNWDCTGDCSGHEAGYEWAEDNGIDDPYDCGGNFDSFIEGCEAYANELLEEEYYEDEDYDRY